MSRKILYIAPLAAWLAWVIGSALAAAISVPLARALSGVVVVLLVVGGGVAIAAFVYAVLIIVPAIAARIGAARGVNVAYDPNKGVMGVGTMVLPQGEPPPRAAQVLAMKAAARKGIPVIEGVYEEPDEEQSLPSAPQLYLP